MIDPRKVFVCGAETNTDCSDVLTSIMCMFDHTGCVGQYERVQNTTSVIQTGGHTDN